MLNVNRPVTDFHRPRYHFLPDNWMNDPKPFFHDGKYHVFFQYYPHGAVEGAKEWGHAVSRDLCRWEILPVALVPSENTPDSRGCWTGCVLQSDDSTQSPFHILYTGVSEFHPLTQTQCLASSGDLIHWTKWPGNPVAAKKPHGFGTCFRDPQVFRHRGDLYMLIGGEKADGTGGAAFLYICESPDLTRWRYLHTLFEGDLQTGFDFECPDFFPLGNEDDWLLITSRHHTWWHAGTLTDELRFVRQTWGQCDGGSFYAAKTLVDEVGRRLMLGWIRESRSAELQKAAGWSGVLSLPRVVSQGDDGLPRFTPAPELAALRGEAVVFENLAVRGGIPFVLPGVAGLALEIDLQFAKAGAAKYGVAVLRSPDGEEGHAVLYDAESKQLGGTPFALPDNEGLHLRIFVDASVIETFEGAGRACDTTRFYAARADSQEIALIADTDTIVERITVWTMGV